MGTKTDQLVEQFDTSNTSDRLIMRYLCNARVAAGLENREKGTDELENDTWTIDIAWSRAKQHFDQLTEQDHESAFETALFLTLIPKDINPFQESIYRWLRGDRPLLLSMQPLLARLEAYLTHDTSNDLFEKLCEYMNYDITRYSRDEIYTQPECFLAVVSMRLCTMLSDDSCHRTKILGELAKRNLSRNDVSRVVRYYYDYAGIAEIIACLEPYLSRE